MARISGIGNFVIGKMCNIARKVFLHDFFGRRMGYCTAIAYSSFDSFLNGLSLCRNFAEDRLAWISRLSERISNSANVVTWSSQYFRGFPSHIGK